MSEEWKNAISVIIGVIIGGGLYYWMTSFFQAQINLTNKRIDGLEAIFTSFVALLLSAQDKQQDDQELKREQANEEE